MLTLYNNTNQYAPDRERNQKVHLINNSVHRSVIKTRKLSFVKMTCQRGVSVNLETS